MVMLKIVGTSSEKYVIVVQQCDDYSTRWQVQALPTKITKSSSEPTRLF